MPDPGCNCLACRVWFGHTSLADGSVPQQRSRELAEAMSGFNIFLMNVLVAVALKATFAMGLAAGIQTERNARFALRNF